MNFKLHIILFMIIKRCIQVTIQGDLLIKQFKAEKTPSNAVSAALFATSPTLNLRDEVMPKKID